MKRACLTVWVLASMLLLMAGTSSGQTASPTRILVLDPESKFLEAGKLADLGKHLRSLAVKYSSLKVLKVSAKGLDKLREKAGCSGSDPKCLALIGQKAEAQRVLYSQIQRLPGRYLLVMTLVDVNEGQILEQSRKRARGGQGALQSALMKSWVDVVGPLFRSKIKVRANIAGADVFLDGHNIGKTPLVLTKTMVKGKHVIEVAHQDHQSVRREIEVKKGHDLEIEVALEKKPAKAPEPVAVAETRPVPMPPVPPPPQPPPEAKAEATPPPEKPKPEPQPEPAAKLEPKPEPKPETAPFLPSMTGPDQSQPPEEERTRVAGGPIYEQWWFWTVVGAVVAGGTTGLILGLSGGDEPAGIPAGKGRVTIEF